MSPLITALLFLGALTSAAPVATFLNTTSTCPTLHVIVARGTCESQIVNKGEGIFYKVANMITAQVPGSDSTGLVYPASGLFGCTTPTYVQSVRLGNSLLAATIQSYSAICPSTKFALIGYSQGGQVVGEVVCGASEKGFGAPLPPLNAYYLDKVVAAITFGNPSYVAGQAYDRGTDTTRNGMAPALGTTATCSGFANRYQSYCNANDAYCATGNSTAVHGQYVAMNGAQGAAFVVERYNNVTATATTA